MAAGLVRWRHFLTLSRSELHYCIRYRLLVHAGNPVVSAADSLTYVSLSKFDGPRKSHYSRSSTCINAAISYENILNIFCIPPTRAVPVLCSVDDLPACHKNSFRLPSRSRTPVFRLSNHHKKDLHRGSGRNKVMSL